jgi:DNA-directed RNA polymerase subunit E'/Rpb7
VLSTTRLQHVPRDFEYQPSSMSYLSVDTGATIRPGCAVRLKILGAGATAQGTSLGAIGSINEPFLGPI